MGNTDLETDASSSSAGRHEEHGVGRRTRKRNTKRGSGRSEAMAAACGGGKSARSRVTEMPAGCCCAPVPVPPLEGRRRVFGPQGTDERGPWAVGCGPNAG